MLAVHKDLPFTVACGGKAFEALLAEADKLGVADTSKVGAIGYCAGGGFALEQARAGANFKGVVVFHVTNPNPVVPGTPCNIKGRVLAIHGRADPVTPKLMMDTLEDELTKAKVDWHIVTFGRGVHSFCDPTANNPAATMYDEKLCRTVLHADAGLFRRDAVAARARPLEKADGHRTVIAGPTPKAPRPGDPSFRAETDGGERFSRCPLLQRNQDQSAASTTLVNNLRSRQATS